MNNVTKLISKSLFFMPKYNFQFPQQHSETHDKVVVS